MSAAEILAVRYGCTSLPRSSCFHGESGSEPVAMDYFVWVVRHGGRQWVVDTGFDPEVGRRRGRTVLVDPVEALRTVGVEAEQVTDVVITHLHYDHAGNLGRFPNATAHVQAAELAFATGARMLQADQRAAYEGREVARVVERLFDGRVAVHEGDATLAPGLTVHVLPGHTPGLQGVRVRTPAGFVLLASDAAHFYRTVETATPFAIFADLGGALAGAERVRSLCGDDGWWVPGHDPEVMRRFEPAPPGEAVRLDQPRMHDRSQL